MKKFFCLLMILSAFVSGVEAGPVVKGPIHYSSELALKPVHYYLSFDFEKTFGKCTFRIEGVFDLTIDKNAHGGYTVINATVRLLRATVDCGNSGSLFRMEMSVEHNDNGLVDIVFDSENEALTEHLNSQNFKRAFLESLNKQIAEYISTL